MQSQRSETFKEIVIPLPPYCKKTMLVLSLTTMNCKRKITIIVLSLAVLFLAGCAHFQKPLVFKPVAWKERQVGLKQITTWEMHGALSVTYDHKRDVVRFKWVQNQDNYNIHISGPLNIGGARIFGDASGVEFCRTRKKCIKADTPEQLTLNQLGWQFPISNIRYWILALPVPCAKIDAVSVDQYGHLTDLHQSGWQIKYSEFQSNVVNNVNLPKVIELTNREVSIKIKVTNHKVSNKK